MSKPKSAHFDTLTLHAGAAPDPVTGARATPIYQTASFVFPDRETRAWKPLYVERVPKPGSAAFSMTL